MLPFKNSNYTSMMVSTVRNLRYLDLSEASFNGEVPHSIGNQSYLEYLDLSMYGSYPLQLWASDLNWVVGLSSLLAIS